MRVDSSLSNRTIIELEDMTILISYKTPVACFISGEGFYRTDTFHSVTTSRHINQWLDGREALELPQNYFDSLLE